MNHNLLLYIDQTNEWRSCANSNLSMLLLLLTWQSRIAVDYQFHLLDEKKFLGNQ